ncbi:hypothetical protein [Roseovarius indicus]|uniref:Acyltransferase n=1 Tax=Roseovarius indicus TaxID=540747 RepID=A0A0T5PAQ9_9RHOB|nr:hypothetical protein [Roseovarius indicus]KRS17950.1 acyltransferase [Roseovarius indicus]QEW27232.1 hypothetical protein RIdsm_03044 [Roseovarius indicus]SFD51907.1 hypothetical protein SAMN04488031_101301 [Roseovarius indicus]
MLLALIGAAIGALLGAVVARRRKGSMTDMLQYGAVFAIMFALAGLFLTIFIVRASG